MESRAPFGLYHTFLIFLSPFNSNPFFYQRDELLLRQQDLWLVKKSEPVLLTRRRRTICLSTDDLRLWGSWHLLLCLLVLQEIGIQSHEM